MAERGWHVDRVELDPLVASRAPTPANVRQFIMDVRDFNPRDFSERYDLVWASPVCTEFARESMPWCRTGAAPDMRMLFWCMGVIATARPKWWAIENVRGAIPWFTPWLGPPAVSAHPIFLWGRVPVAGLPRVAHKERLSSKQRAERSRVPYEVSLALAESVERVEGLPTPPSPGPEGGTL